MMFAEEDPRQLERVARVIPPGGWAVEGQQPMATLLGSCVAVCLWEPQLKLAGMNHFLLPSRVSRATDDPDIVLAGDYSMEVLVNGMLARGASKRRLVAKVFGGGTIVDTISAPVGVRNVRFATEWLQREGVTLLASDVGGAFSRKVVMLPTTGDAYCRRQSIRGVEGQRLLDEERSYQLRLQQTKAAAGVELF